METNQPLTISNESVAVYVRKVHTRNGERLEIGCPSRGTAVRLDAIELESLSWQRPETFVRLRRARPPGATE